MKSIAYLLVGAVVFALIGSWGYGYFSPEREQARSLRMQIDQALRLEEWFPAQTFPDSVVCFVPEHRFAPYYVQNELKGTVVFSEGDESDGVWSMIIMTKEGRDAWIFQISMADFYWENEGFTCPSRVGSALQNSRRVIIAK